MASIQNNDIDHVNRKITFPLCQKIYKGIFHMKQQKLIILFLSISSIILGFYFLPNNFNLSESSAQSSKKILFPKSNTIRCIVYVVDRAGRLGNRMFIVASAYGLARLHSCHLYINDTILNEIRQTFQSDFSPILISSTKFQSMIQNVTSTSKVSKNVGCQYILELTRPNAIPKGQFFELTGYWQSYLHFIKYADELRQNIFTGKPSVIEKISNFFLDISQKNFHTKLQFSSYDHHKFKQELSRFSQSVWIGIHIRRSDFAHLRFSSSDEYVLTAIQYFTKRYSNATFIVASDDKSYCQNLFKNHRNVFITPSGFWEGDDLVILSLCEHTIVTGGTFGWWAGFLANGEVLHDKVYPSGCEKREQYYPPWFLIDGYVRAHKNSNYSI